MYERAKDLLRLAILMQGSTTGLSLDDIQDKFSVGRRTAERMLDAAKDLFGTVQPIRIDDQQRRYWSIPDCNLKLLDPKPEELAHLAAAAAAMRQQNREDAALALDSIGSKFLASVAHRRLTQIEPDLELLLESEGLAMRPGPRIKIEPGVLTALRAGILASHKLRIRYRTRGSAGESWHKICPYGFLYGNRPYLVAFSRNPQILDFRTYRVSSIIEVEDTKEPFERDTTFSLDAFARRSFGVWQEKPFDVVWKFTPEAAPDAREYVFHPDQVVEDLADGSLIVRFRAGGAREMAWHLYTWGEDVKVLEPDDFWERAES